MHDFLKITLLLLTAISSENHQIYNVKHNWQTEKKILKGFGWKTLLRLQFSSFPMLFFITFFHQPTFTFPCHKSYNRLTILLNQESLLFPQSSYSKYCYWTFFIKKLVNICYANPLKLCPVSQWPQDFWELKLS